MGNTRVFISYAFVDDKHPDYLFAQRLAGDIRHAGADVVVDTANLGDQAYVQQMNRVLLSCQWLIVIQTTEALRSLRVQLNVNMALQLVTHQQLQGVLAVLAAPCDTQDIPTTWNTLQVIDAREDYPRALARALLALGLGSSGGEAGTQTDLSLLLEPHPSGHQPIVYDRPSDLSPLSAMVYRGGAEQYLSRSPGWLDRPSTTPSLPIEIAEAYGNRMDRPKPISRRRRSDGKRRALVPALLLMMLLVVGGCAFTLHGLLSSDPIYRSAATPGRTSAATVMITPAAKDFEKTYLITAAPGTPNPAQHLIDARQLDSTQSQSESIIATGSGTTPTAQARGMLGFYSAEGKFTYTAGTVFTDDSRSGYTLQIVLDATVTVSSGQPGNPGAYAPAHALIGGTSGNLPVDSIWNDSDHGGLGFYNTSAFTGGQNAQNYAYLQQSDITNAAAPLISALRTSAQEGLRSQVLANEQLAQQTQCDPEVTSRDPVNSHVSSTTFTVSVTCAGEAFNPQDAQNMALQLLQHDATADPNALYRLSGKATISIIEVQASRTRRGALTIAVQVESTGIFQFSATQKQHLALAIAGQSEREAQAYLAQQGGIARAVITLAAQDDSTLPTDPREIAIIVT